MKTFGLAPLAVVVLWLSLSTVWMAQSAPPTAALASTTEDPAATALVARGMAAAPAGPVMIDLSRRAPLGPIMTELLTSPVADAAPTAMAPSASGDETLLRLQTLEARLAAALETLERRGGDVSSGSPAALAPSFPQQVATVLASAPVIGFLLMLLLALAVAGWGRPSRPDPVAGGIRATLHRLTAPRPDAAGQPQPESPHPDSASAGRRRIYGQIMSHIQADGQPLRAGVFDENQVRAAAGLTLALGAAAFAYAAIGKVYQPIQMVTALFFAEFLIRVTWGITRSPLGLIAGWMTRRRQPHWVSAKPKRFAWSMGLVMSLAMMVITNSGIRGPLPLTICLICLTLMWLEAVLGLCLGCEIHRYLVRNGWMQPDKDFEICTNGTCSVLAQPRIER